MISDRATDCVISPRAQESAELRIEREFGKVVREHPEYGEAMDRVWDMLLKYRIPENRWLTDSLYQEQNDARPRDIDILFYSELVFQLLKGHLFYTGINIACPPRLDSAESLLDELTLATVKTPFAVGFVDGDNGREPVISWREPIVVHSHREGRIHVTQELAPGCAFLSIGYTRAIRTGLNLRDQKVIGRWPHGYNFIYLLSTDLQGLFEGITDLSTWLDDRI
jgi:hypothetical protein